MNRVSMPDGPSRTPPGAPAGRQRAPAPAPCSLASRMLLILTGFGLGFLVAALCGVTASAPATLPDLGLLAVESRDEAPPPSQGALRTYPPTPSPGGAKIHTNVVAPNAAEAAQGSEGEPAAVVVFGFHHTGTSLLTLLLMQLGLEAGPLTELLRLQDNPVKYFELGRAVHLDEKFVEKHSDHLSPAWPAYGYEWGRASQAEQVTYNKGVRTIIDWLDATAGPKKTWVVKDPRLCLVAESWLSQIQRKRICVIAARDPIECAVRFSRFTRSWAPVKNLEAWEEYNVRAIQGCRNAGATTIIAKHSVLMTKPYELAKQLHSELVAAGAKNIFLPSEADFQQKFLRLWYKRPKVEQAQTPPVRSKAQQTMDELISVRAKRVWQAEQAEDLDMLTDEELMHTSWTHT